MSRANAIRCLLLLVLYLGATGAVHAQLPETGAEPSATSTASPVPDPVMRRMELEQRLHEIAQSLKNLPASEPIKSPTGSDQVPTRRTSMQRMENSLRRLLSLLEKDALLEAQLQQVDSENTEFTQKGLTERRPYPITLLDSLRDELSRAEDELASQEAALRSAQVDSRMTGEQLADLQALRRRLLESSQKTRQQDIELERRLENAGWAVQAYEAAQQVAQAEMATARKASLLAQKRGDLLQRKVSLVQTHFLFTESILQAQLDELEARRKELYAALEQSRAAGESALAKVKALQEEEPGDSAAVQAQTEWLTTHQRIKSLIEQQLEWNLTQRDLWERRYELSSGEGVASLSDWRDASQGLIAQLRNGRVVLESELKQLRLQGAQVLEEPASEGGERTRRLQALSAREMALERALRSLDATSTLAQRIVTEITTRRKDLSWQERSARAWAGLTALWYFELYTIGDNSVTVGKVCGALLVLGLGLTTAGRVSRFFSKRLLARLPIADAVRVNLERGMRYIFFLFVFLFALRVVNIPLTIFTFLGGTLAIAVGFGAQNILNNFISGLILMVERPVRVGDLIEVEQTTGVVEEIGARSTRVLMGTGIHVVLPNSLLLENRVVNWTLTDQRVRTSVKVGAAYGCDPEEVITLIKRATLLTDRIEKSPEPFVFLEDFADSALIFTVHFWVSLAHPLNKSSAESDLRILIERLFRENGISIPFPQRDVNFQGPVPVTVLEPREPKHKEISPE